MKYDRKINLRLTEEQYSDISVAIEGDEGISEFIRKAIDYLITARMVHRGAVPPERVTKGTKKNL